MPLPFTSSHPILASCFQPPKCSALCLAWLGTLRLTPAPLSLPLARGVGVRPNFASQAVRAFAIGQLPLAPLWTGQASAQVMVFANLDFPSTGSCSARTVSLTTSVSSRTTTASVNGGRLVRFEKIVSEVIQWQQSDMNPTWQTQRSGMLVYPYLLSVYSLGAGKWNLLVNVSTKSMLISSTATTYAMCRMVLVSFP